MKASDLTLNELLNLRNEAGGTFLKDHRMIISSADAWGVLARDLIVALGIDRARRFLMRYGWHCGAHEAEVFKNLYPWDDEKEWLLAGQKFHNISGRVFSHLVRLNVDFKKGIFDAEGYWFNSYEANQFLKHFPKHNEPVCYFLVGYASGYTSAIVGKKIIFKEVACVAKGDEHCRYVGKTVDLWGDEASDELLNYEQDSLADELDRAYKRIEHQREVLTRVTTISQELTQIILQGKGFDAIAETLGKSLNCGVIIENQHFEPIARYGSVAVCPLHKMTNPKDGDFNPENYRKVQKMLEERCTVQLKVSGKGGAPHFRLITPIVLRNQISGFISLIKTDGEFGSTEPVLMERAANICALQILYEQIAIETEQRMKGDLLDDLLENLADSAYAMRRHAVLGHHLNQPHYVFVFQVEHQDLSRDLDHDMLGSRIKKIKDLLVEQVEFAGFQLLVSTKFDRVHALIPEAFFQKTNRKLKDFGQFLVSQLQQPGSPMRILLGISNRCSDIAELHPGYKETIKAIEIAKLKHKSDSVILASDLGHLSILLDARRPEELERYADKLLSALDRYDKQYSTEFMKTLYYYIYNECNLYKTARFLNVSISGMRYRLNRIKDLIQIDLNNASARFEVQMALEIYLILGKIAL